MQFIDLNRQYKTIEQQIDQRIKKVLQHSQFVLGPEVHELEQLLAKFTKVKHCITVASGTDALLIAMMAAGIQPGDEIITTAFTFFATVETMMLLGATPKFIDIDPQTYLMNVNEIEKAITPRTKAIMPISLYGQVADMETINAIAKKYQLAVIEDGAQSFGAKYKGGLSCGLSTLGCTSFFPTKPLACYGDGGAIFTNDDQLAQKIKELRVHGQSQRYVHTSLGINGRFDTIQAAILLEKLQIFEDETLKRNEIAAYYSERLKEHVVVPKILDDNTHVFAQYTIRVKHRDEFCNQLLKEGIPTAVHYPIPLTKQPCIKNMAYAQVSLPHTELAAEEVVSLPMHPYLTPAEIEKVSKTIINSITETITA